MPQHANINKSELSRNGLLYFLFVSCVSNFTMNQMTSMVGMLEGQISIYITANLSIVREKIVFSRKRTHDNLLTQIPFCEH